MDDQYYLKTKSEFQGLVGGAVNVAYYSARETTLSAIEYSMVQSRWEQSFSSATFGSSAQFILSSDDIIAGTYVHLVLPKAAIGNGLALPFGWGLAAIESVTYLFPSNNIGRITLTQTELFHLILAQQKDYASCTLIMMLMGQAVDSTGSVAAISDKNRSADVLIPFPWSSFNEEVKGIDAHLFKSGSITVTIKLAEKNRFIKAAAGSGLTLPGFESVSLSYRQGTFSNLGYSLRSKLDANPGLAYSYPFIRTDQKDAVVSVTSATNGNQRMLVSLSGFLQADLLGMIITVHKLNNVETAIGGTLDPYSLVNIKNVNLTYASQVMYSSRDFAYRLYGCQSVNSSGYDSASSIISLGTVSPKSNFPVFIDFSQKRQAAFGDMYYNVKRYDGKTMNLTFEPGYIVDEATDWVTVPPITSTDLLVRITVLYNAVVEVSQGSNQMMLL